MDDCADSGKIASKAQKLTINFIFFISRFKVLCTPLLNGDERNLIEYRHPKIWNGGVTDEDGFVQLFPHKAVLRQSVWDNLFQNNHAFRISKIGGTQGVVIYARAERLLRHLDAVVATYEVATEFSHHFAKLVKDNQIRLHIGW